MMWLFLIFIAVLSIVVEVIENETVKSLLCGFLCLLIFTPFLYSDLKDLYIIKNGETVEVTITDIDRHTKGLNTAHFIYNDEKCSSSCSKGKNIGDILSLYYVDGLGFYPQGNNRACYFFIVLFGFFELVGLIVFLIGLRNLVRNYTNEKRLI